MAHTPFRNVQIVATFFASFPASGAANVAAQSVIASAVDPARRLTRQKIELAVAAYVGQDLARENAQYPEFLRGLALDRRSTDYGRTFDGTERPRREAQHSARLAKAMGVHLTDGRNAVTCASPGTGCRYHIGRGRGLLRMSVPRVHNDSARVSVHLVTPTTDNVTMHEQTWDLLLLNQAGTWKVVEHPHSRISY